MNEIIPAFARYALFGNAETQRRSDRRPHHQGESIMKDAVQLQLFKDKEGSIADPVTIRERTVAKAHDLSQKMVESAREGSTDTCAGYAKELFGICIEAQSTADKATEIYKSTLRYIAVLFDHVDIAQIEAQ